MAGYGHSFTGAAWGHLSPSGTRCRAGGEGSGGKWSAWSLGVSHMASSFLVHRVNWPKASGLDLHRTWYLIPLLRQFYPTPTPPY